MSNDRARIDDGDRARRHLVRAARLRQPATSLQHELHKVEVRDIWRIDRHVAAHLQGVEFDGAD